MPDLPRRLPALASLALCLAGLSAASPALAAPGLGEEVYGATVEAHELELEARYGRLNGGTDNAADNSRLEAQYGVTGNLALASVIEFERDPGGPRKATHLGFEGIYHVGRFAGVDMALYQEFEIGLNGDPDGSETKLLFERRAGLWDTRFNLIAEKPFDKTIPVQFSYAASADVKVAKPLRLGLTAFGDLGTVHHFVPSAEHYLGPVATWRIALPDPDGDGDDDHAISIETGYLFAIGQTRDTASGQMRINFEVEF